MISAIPSYLSLHKNPSQESVKFSQSLRMVSPYTGIMEREGEEGNTNFYFSVWGCKYFAYTTRSSITYHATHDATAHSHY